ncbi:P-loop containing nucleoside triphosphate hydrolase protein [Parasitella parasitica]|nr:P-loop containing nucleoside triphosphate hydrolase protein [Parasitella parasitica]
MAPLQVIGAGFGRTGTDSLRLALNILGYKTHHMKSFWEEEADTRPEDFIEAYNNRDEADWDKVYKNYSAAVDWPTVEFYKDLVAKYPEAKVVLTVRSADSWYKSALETIHPASAGMLENPADERKAQLGEMMKLVVLNGHMVNRETFRDEEMIKKLFLNHYEEVKNVVPSDNLLVMELGEGWSRLCDFLGKEIPKEPYPNANSKENFKEVLAAYNLSKNK